LIAENASFNELLDNCDDVLSKTNKEKREYRSLLEEAKEKVIELESMLIDTRSQIESMKSSPVVTDEPKCNECSVFLGDLTVLREKYASKIEELDVARVELDELRSRFALLGACTSCPILHAKLDESRACIKSLEADLKSLIATYCYSCEVTALKTLSLHTMLIACKMRMMS
jgi:DNA repair exonuclease SbcCD ATPase subunit